MGKYANDEFRDDPDPKPEPTSSRSSSDDNKPSLLSRIHERIMGRGDTHTTEPNDNYGK